MNRLPLLAVALFVVAASAVPLERQEKAVSLFTVVNFPNDECTTQDDTALKGVCFSTSECTDKGGTADGNCAAGFGVCCLFRLKACGGSFSQNCTYAANLNYPTVITTASESCAYNVQTESDICQIRLDFENFVMPIATTGICNGGLTMNGPTSRDPPVMCGTQTGEHMYIEVGGSTTATVLTFATGTGTTNRSWNIKVTQYACDSLMKAPTDCAQYHTGPSGKFQSPNFTNGLLQANLEYAICFRREKGYCQIAYNVDNGSTTPDAYDLVGATATVIERETCPNQRLSIPFTTGTGIFCGEFFGITLDDTIGGVVVQKKYPFMIVVNVLATTTTTATGFKMVYNQISC